MKRLAMLVILLAVAGSVAIGNALANDPNPVAQSTGFLCGVADTIPGVVGTGQSSDTLYQSGKEQLHCVGQGHGTGVLVNYSAFSCRLVFTGVSFNPNNYDRISKTGESQLTCFNDPYSTPGSFAELGAQ